MYESVPPESSTAAIFSTTSLPFRVLVSGWVIGDGSFPRASVGDDVEAGPDHMHLAGEPMRRQGECLCGAYFMGISPEVRAAWDAEEAAME